MKQAASWDVFGWWSGDDTWPRNVPLNGSKGFRDHKGETTFELVLDCDQQIISYFNARTKAVRELNIDVKKCPFPWQVIFNLYDSVDQVPLIPFS